MYHILVVEDEKEMQRGLRDNLEFEEYTVDVADNGVAGLQLIKDKNYDLVLLDVMMPKMSGFDVCRKAREAGVKTPIIMLTAKGEEIDKVLGLEFGADDYITKPFSVRELLARVKAVLRRAPVGTPTLAPILIGQVEVDFSSYKAMKKGKEIEMTPKEINILCYLWQHQGQAVSRDELLKQVWGYDESITSRTVDNFILKLRKKVEKDPSAPRHIVSIHGVGYRLIV
jgi:DNA-binding response OmpR family regulator